MKKLLAMILALILTGAMLTGCNSESDSSSEYKKVTTSATSNEESSVTETTDEESSTTESNSEESSEGESSNEENIPIEEISNDMYDFEMLINGKKFKIPSTVNELEDIGFKINETTENKYNMQKDMQPNTALRFDSINDDGNKIYFDIYNDKEEAVSYRDATIRMIMIGNTLFKKYNPDVILAKNIILNKSTYSDVIEAYGTPTKENSDNTVVTYKSPNKEIYMTYVLNFEDNVLCKIELHCIPFSNSNN